MIYLLFGGFFLFLVFETWQSRRAVSYVARASRMRNVQPLDEIYRIYYEKRGIDRQVLETVWKELALALEIDPGRLRPDDRFDRLVDNGRPGILTERVEEIMEHYLSYRALLLDFKTIDHLIVAIGRNWHQQQWLLGKDLQART